MGFEPILSAWKAEVLPITPIPHMARAEGFEPPLTVLETAVLPLHQARIWRRAQDSNPQALSGPTVFKTAPSPPGHSAN